MMHQQLVRRSKSGSYCKCCWPVAS